MGILQLYNTIQAKKADLAESRAARNQASAQQAWESQQRNTLGYAQIQSNMDQQKMQSQTQLELAKIQATSAAERQKMEWDARLKIEADREKEAARRAYEESLRQFGKGEPIFVPPDQPIPESPMLQVPGSDEKVPAFGVHTQTVPGKGTFVVPYDPRTEGLKIEKQESDRRAQILKEIDEIGRIEKQGIETDQWKQKLKEQEIIGVPTEIFRSASDHVDRVEKQLAKDMEALQARAFGARPGDPTALKSLNDYKQDKRQWLIDHLGEDAYQSYLSSSAIVNGARARATAAAQTPEPGGPAAHSPDQLHAWVGQAMDRLNNERGVNSYAPKPPPPPPGSIRTNDTVIFRRDPNGHTTMIGVNASRSDIASASSDPNLVVITRTITSDGSGKNRTETYTTPAGNPWDPHTGKIAPEGKTSPTPTPITPPRARTANERSDIPVTIQVPGTTWNRRVLPEDAARFNDILSRVSNGQKVSPADSNFLRQMQYEKSLRTAEYRIGNAPGDDVTPEDYARHQRGDYSKETDEWAQSERNMKPMENQLLNNPSDFSQRPKYVLQDTFGTGSN